MAATDKVSHILLPLGIENEFFEAVGEFHTPRGLDFRLDTGAFQYLAEEFVSQGALVIAVDPCSAFAEQIDEVAPVFRRRVRILDESAIISKRTLSVVRPIADELGVDVESMHPCIHSWMGPQIAACVSEKDPKRQSLLEDLFFLHATSYHLLLGIKHGLQVDISLYRAWAAVHRLRRACISSSTRANLAFLQSLIGSYSVASVGCLRALPHINSAELVDSFNEFLEDEIYRQLSREKYRLGLPLVARKALTATRTLARRLVRKKLFGRFFDYGTKAVSVGTGIPLPNSEIASAIVQEAYLPPVVDLSQPIDLARRAWAQRLPPGRSALGVTSPLLSRRRVRPPLEMKFSDGVLWVAYDFFDLTEAFDLNIFPEPSERRLQESFGHYFAVNLDPPRECSSHATTFGIESVKVEWLEQEVRFTVRACCEEAAKANLIALLAYDKSKSYARKDRPQSE